MRGGAGPSTGFPGFFELDGYFTKFMMLGIDVSIP
jgi:hypothetical protein